MPPARWAEFTYPEAEQLAEGAVAILPVGAVEAHGPHLPLSTDGVIAGAMATAAATRLEREGRRVAILPSLDYTAAPFAAGFAGTLSVRPETVTAMVVDLGEALARQRVAVLAVANAHLDPTHLGSLHAAAERLAAAGAPRVAFPDLTRRRWATRLTEEFRSGACHAGRFEGSIVLAERPDLVEEEVRSALEPNPRSLSEAIRDGRSTFEEAGGPRAYFGDPAAATAAEGRETIALLGAILYEAIVEALEAGDSSRAAPAGQ